MSGEKDFHAVHDCALSKRLGMVCRLGVLFMYEAPTIFWALWHAVSPFIDPETKKKVSFVYGTSAAEDFQRLIAPEVSSAFIQNYYTWTGHMRKCWHLNDTWSLKQLILW